MSGKNKKSRVFDKLLKGVVIEGIEIPLKAPTIEQLQKYIHPELKQYMKAVDTITKSNDMSPDNGLSVLTLQSQLTNKAVMLAIAEDLDEGEAGQLVAMGGGIHGELARRCRDMCGIDVAVPRPGDVPKKDLDHIPF